MHEILKQRLINQKLSLSDLRTPQSVVKYLGAMQSQEYAMAKWAIGLRLPGSTDSEIEKAFNSGKILRTHVLRPTWHFVSPDDILWMLELTSPRVGKLLSHYDKKIGLTSKLLKKSIDIVVKSLEGKNFLSRNEIKAILANEGIKADGMLLAHIMMHGELDGIICSGPRAGRQFTYALICERAPKAVKLSYQNSLEKLSKIYFSTRGPATVHDFSWWSGLTVKQAREGIEILGSKLTKMADGAQEYYYIENKLLNKSNTLQSTFLMPDYDEYGISYKDRALIFGKKSNGKGDPIFSHSVIVDGVLGGTWEKTQVSDGFTAKVKFKSYLSAKNFKEIHKAVKKYEVFWK